MDGEAVHVPKGMHLLVDVDSTPVLSFVTVEGSLIFDPSKDHARQRTFDATHILVKGGYLEVGTEEHPYTSKLTITMHGREFVEPLPVFGNKVLGVHSGHLEMHGAPRDVPWTELKTTAEAGATEITINDMGGRSLDWAVGEEIVIASTDFHGRHAEKRTIQAIRDTSSSPIITLDSPLAYKHYAGREEHGDHSLEMRAEVGLLSRNVVFRGDPETSAVN
jgi:cell migration-inducing and hyaluronan-binding protein